MYRDLIDQTIVDAVEAWLAKTRVDFESQDEQFDYLDDLVNTTMGDHVEDE